MALGVLLPFIAYGQASDTFPITVQYGSDAAAPTTPGPVTATPVATTQIDVSWGASTDSFSGVAGYQVFRDLVQIATTTTLFYSDIGLTASTTYSYTIRAFDQSLNFSSSSIAVATTTLAIVPPAAISPEGPTYGQAPKPSVEDLRIEPGARSARVTFHTPMFSQYELRYGTTPSYELGSIGSGIYRIDHQTFVTQLEPNTTYYYELFLADRFGQEAVVATGSFVTEPSVIISRPSNVFDLRADVVGNDVLLHWQIPSTKESTYVRVVRNHRFFPTDPWDGVVVYEGTAESFTDATVLRDRLEQFYTVFTFNLDGQYSSGAVVNATREPRNPLVLPPLLEPDPVATTTDSGSETATTVPPKKIVWPRFTDIEIVQLGTIHTAPADELEVQTKEPFLLRIPYDTVPAHLKVVMVTLGMPNRQAPQASYLLRANTELTYYEAEISSLQQPAHYPLRLTVYDVTDERLVTIGGTLVAAGATDELVAEGWLPWALYFGGMFLVGMCSGGIWWWFIAWRRRRQEEEKSLTEREDK